VIDVVNMNHLLVSSIHNIVLFTKLLLAIHISKMELLNENIEPKKN